MRHRIIFAMGNEGEVRETRLILADLGLPILSMKEAGAEPEIVKDGTTFEENAEIKARAVWNLTGDIVSTDDSGLEVDYISRELGIYSAWYLGEDTPYEVENRSIIERPKGATGQKHSAGFVCSIAAMLPDGRILHTEAVIEGLAAGGPVGNEDSGYDPILYLPQFGKTSAEIIMEQKNEISRKGKVLRVMKGVLGGVSK